MKKSVGFCLATALSFSTITPTVFLNHATVAQAATISEGKYDVKVNSYFDGKLSERGALGPVATLEVTKSDQKLTITLMDVGSYAEILDAAGKNVVINRHSDGSGTITLQGKDIVKNGVAVKLHVVVESIDYDHYYNMVYQVEEDTLVSQEAAMTARSLTAAITNNVGSKDRVTVKGTRAGDIIRLYRNDLPIGEATAKGSEVTINVSQLGKSSGTINVSAQADGERESGQTKFTYKAEPVSSKITASKVSIVNKVGTKNDTVKISGLAKNDVVKVYDYLGNRLKAVTATKSSVSFTMKELKKKGGNLYITRASIGKNASSKVKVAYKAEPVSSKILASKVIVSNKVGTSKDTVTVKGLKKGEVVRVYNAKGTVLKKVTATTSTVKVATKKLSKKGGALYITRTQSNKNESAKVKKTYKAEK